MKLVNFKNIVTTIMLLGVFGLAWWVSRVPHQSEELTATPMPIATAPAPSRIMLVVDQPASGYVGSPEILIKGRFVGNLNKIRYDFINVKECRTDFGNYLISWGPGPADVATNYFECRELPLAPGTNLIILRALFDDGRQLTNQITCILDYGKYTNPPDLKIVWPSNGTSIGGSTFNLQALVPDAFTTIHVSVARKGAPPLEFDDAIVEHNGQAIVKDLPLEDGTNIITVTAKDVAGNASTTNLSIYTSPVKITMRPVNPNQVGHQFASVSGMISDASLAVWVNGEQADVSTNGQWMADRVVSSFTRILHSQESNLDRFGHPQNATYYFTVSAFNKKTKLAEQRFEAGP